MVKYKTKQVTIEVIQYTLGMPISEIDTFMGGQLQVDTDGDYYIPIPEGKTYIQLDDFIIRGLKGEFYIVKPNVFHMKYEKVED